MVKPELHYNVKCIHSEGHALFSYGIFQYKRPLKLKLNNSIQIWFSMVEYRKPFVIKMKNCELMIETGILMEN